jgi:CBS-domain-containing membrane protein
MTKTTRGLIREDFVSALAESDTIVDITVDNLMALNTRAEKHARFRITGGLRVADLMTRSVVAVGADCSLS